MALIKCEECGKEISNKASNCPECGCPVKGQLKESKTVKTEVTFYKGFWSAGRLSIGIISIVLFVFITFQSCAVGLGNALQDNGDTSGSSGFALAIFMLVAGIVGISTRNSKGKVGSYITTALYWLAGLMAMGSNGNYGDLPIWGVLSFIFGVVFLICGIKTKKSV